MTGSRDCTGIELRWAALAGDHLQRSFFPEAWALSWCGETRESRIAKASVFGITEEQLDGVMAWADASFGSEFGAWSVFFTLEAAQAAARLILRNTPELDLWGVGLHRSLLPSYCEASKPLPSSPGYAPTGASGTHIAACVRSLPLAEGGKVLGHEILINDTGSCLNSPESRHRRASDPIPEFRSCPSDSPSTPSRSVSACTSDFLVDVVEKAPENVPLRDRTACGSRCSRFAFRNESGKLERILGVVGFQRLV